MKRRSDRRLRKQRVPPATQTTLPSQRKNELMTNAGYRTLAALVVLGGPATTLPEVAHAQTAAQQACKGDYQRLCANVSPGGGRIIACLQNHSDKLSAACKDALAKSGK